MARTWRVRVLVAAVGVSGTLWAAPATARAAAPPSPAPGYWLAGADGGVFAFNAPFLGSGTVGGTQPAACTFSPQGPVGIEPAGGGSTAPSSPQATGADGCVGIAASPGDGYWLLNAYRSATGFGPGARQVEACTSPTGAQGSWAGMAYITDGFILVSTNGGVMGCDGAVPAGGTTALPLAAPIVGVAPTPDGNGYWLVGADGGVFAFGDAAFEGSMGGTPLAAPVVGMAVTPDGNGYWLVGADGGVFAFGDAAFEGSMGGTPLAAPVVGMAADPSGDGYWLAAADGGVFAFGAAPFEGSMGGRPLDAPVVGIAAFPGPAPG